MTAVSYTCYPYIGNKLTSTHLGKTVVRVYPHKKFEGIFSFDCMATHPACINYAASMLITVSASMVIVKKDHGSELLLPNDGHWLLLDDFKTKIVDAVSEIFPCVDTDYKFPDSNIEEFI